MDSSGISYELPTYEEILETIFDMQTKMLNIYLHDIGILVKNYI